MNRKTVAHLVSRLFSMILLLSLLFSNYAFSKFPILSEQKVITSIPALKIANSPVFEETSSSLAEAIGLAVENHRSNPSYSYYYNIINIIENGEWGLGKAEKIQKDTLEVIPADISMILCHQEGSGSWQVVLPNDVDPYLHMLNLFPTSLVDNSTKEYIRDAYKVSSQTTYSDHYLPWEKDSAAFVYQNYSTHGEGQLDFGFTGSIRTTKAGTLYFAYDSHTWSECTGQTSCNYPYAWYYNNAVVIKHADGEYSAYLHLQTDSIPSEIIDNCNSGIGGSCTAVNVPVGTVIGNVGSTGYSTATHLHYGTGDYPYGRCNYPDVYDEDGDGNTEETNICTGGIDGSHRISTSFYEKPYSASNCGTGDGQDPTLCMLYYPTNTNLISQNPGSGGVSFNDDFNGSTLNPLWHWYNEDPTHWSLTASPGNLRIIGKTGDMWSTCNNPANILLQQAPDGDFVIQTKLSIHPTTEYQQGGLIFFNDVDNYLKLDVLWAAVAGGENVEFLQEQNGEIPEPLSWPYFTVDLNQPAFLMIIKSGNTYTGYYSPDGQVWSILGSITDGTIEYSNVGIYALSGVVDTPTCVGSVPDIEVDFDYFWMATGIVKTDIFASQATYDGWILESTETSGVGGAKNNTSKVFYVGDDAYNRQYRSILSFNTAGIPDDAVITKVTLKIKKAGLVGTNPYKTHKGLRIDIRKGKFGTSKKLQLSDFQAKASKNLVGKFKKISSSWYKAVLGSAAHTRINKTGTTQFRLRFYKDDNNDYGADYMTFYSGNAGTNSRPQLIVEYYVP